MLKLPPAKAFSFFIFFFKKKNPYTQNTDPQAQFSLPGMDTDFFQQRLADSFCYLNAHIWKKAQGFGEGGAFELVCTQSRPQIPSLGF